MDKEFINRVITLVKKLIPTWKCIEMGYVVVLAGLLIIRTMMSIWLADVNGLVVKAIVNKDLKMFIKRIFVLFLFALPSSTVNSAIDFVTKRMALSFRERLTTHFHDTYL